MQFCIPFATLAIATEIEKYSRMKFMQRHVSIKKMSSSLKQYHLIYVHATKAAATLPQSVSNVRALAKEGYIM